MKIQLGGGVPHRHNCPAVKLLDSWEMWRAWGWLPLRRADWTALGAWNAPAPCPSDPRETRVPRAPLLTLVCPYTYTPPASVPPRGASFPGKGAPFRADPHCPSFRSVLFSRGSFCRKEILFRAEGLPACSQFSPGPWEMLTTLRILIRNPFWPPTAESVLVERFSIEGAWAPHFVFKPELSGLLCTRCR